MQFQTRKTFRQLHLQAMPQRDRRTYEGLVRGVPRERLLETQYMALAKQYNLGDEHVGSALAELTVAEWKWEARERPYYCVFPSIVDALTRVSLDIPADQIHCPGGSLSVRLPDDSQLFKFYQGGRPYHIRELLLFEFTNKPESVGPHAIREGLSVWLNLGTYRNAKGQELPRTECLGIEYNADKTVEQSLADDYIDKEDLPPIAVITPKGLARRVMRLVVTLCLLPDDPDILEPDVLADDRKRLDRGVDEQTAQRLVDKAKRRGKNGHIIGRKWDELAAEVEGEESETTPHFRRPHFAIRWMGRGKDTPKRPVLRPVKAAWVKRHRLHEVPMGYHDHDDEGNDDATT